MPLRKKLLREAALYLILDRQVNDYEKLFEIARQVAGRGVDIFQLRDKKGTSREIWEFSRRLHRLLRRRALFIVNDRVDLALSGGADGVHLGQDDLPLHEARRILGKKSIIGVSCQTYPQARRAQEEGADYIGLGSVFKTATKPRRRPMDLRLLTKVYRNIKIPVFVIGGIDARNIGRLKAAGANRFAVCRAVCQALHVAEAVSNIKKEIGGW